jgi:hypothetical protein
VFEYFVSQFGYSIQNPELPLIHIGNPARTIYVPLERVHMKAQVS